MHIQRPADYADEIVGYGEDGELSRQPWNGAFEVAFAHDGSAGTVDLYAEGGKQVRDELSEIFAEVVLGQDKKPEPCRTQPYDLELFKNPGLAFPTDPMHRIITVSVTALRVRTHGHAGGTIMIDAGVRGSRSSVYDVIRATFADEKADLAHDTILGARAVRLPALPRALPPHRPKLQEALSGRCRPRCAGAL